jgi:signal transduction histidine kinase
MNDSFFGQVVDQAPLGIIVLARDLSVRYMNQAALALHGQARHAPFDKISFADLATEPDAVREALDLVCSQAVTSLIIPYEVHTGSTRRFMLATAGLMKCDECEHEEDGLLLIADDVTARKELEAEIVETEKTALIGQMLLTLQHEINNPLQVIFGQVDVALASAVTTDELKANLGEIQKAAHRIAILLRHLSSLDRVETVQYINHMKMINLDNTPPE